MSVEEVDFIVIGSGHNGLIAANYLARCGQKVVVFEKRLEAGGGLTTEEVTLPGFLHNLHSFFHDTIDIMPAYEDLELKSHHAEYMKPPVQAALPLEDGRALIFHTDIEKTMKSIRRFSEKDAEAYKEYQAEYTEYMETVVVPALYSSPSEPSEQIQAMEETDEGLEYLRLCRASPFDIVNEMFESDALRSLILYQLGVPRGAVFDYAGTGFFVPLIISQIEDSQICIGGSHRLAHALWKALLSSGNGAIKGTREVVKIILEKNKATGVQLKEGEIIKAKKAVISAVDFSQTLNRLVGEPHLSDEINHALGAYKLDEFSIFSVHLALNDAPSYKAAKFDEDINKALKINIGFESTDDFIDHWSEIRQGKIPLRIRMYCTCPTLFDASQAPEGKHTAILWLPVPYKIKDQNWNDIKEELSEKCIAELAKFAPNVDKKNILKKAVFTPEDIEQKFINMKDGAIFMGRLSFDQIEYFRPHPLFSQYSTPIENLYLCGACTHPGGGIIGGGGYNAAGVIADDFELDKWWD